MKKPQRNFVYRVWCRGRTVHRTHGPAIEQDNGNKMWFKMEKLHRLDGPAQEGTFLDIDRCVWCVNGNEIKCRPDFTDEEMDAIVYRHSWLKVVGRSL
jgi:hypothetical protein